MAILVIGLSVFSIPQVFASDSTTSRSVVSDSVPSESPRGVSSVVTANSEVGHVIEIYYICASGRIDKHYLSNGIKIENLWKELGGRRILSAEITGYTSPDGSLQFNRDLAFRRAKSFADLLVSTYGLSYQDIKLKHPGIDWEGLRRLVQQSDMKNAADIIDIIDNVPELTTAPNGRWLDSRKKHLMDYNGGRDYMWMLHNIFPALRRTYAVIVIEDEQPEPEPMVMEETAPVEKIDSLPEPEPMVMEETAPVEIIDSLPEPEPEVVPDTIVVCDYHHVFAFRSNLLLPLLNVGAVLPIGNRVSLGVDYYYPWSWRRANHKNCFELIFISAETRLWLGERNIHNRLKGHSIGAYGAWGYYDIERNYHGHQGHGWSFGVDYMISVPVAHDKLHFEFEIGFGGIISRGAQPYNVREVGGRLIREKGVKKNFYYWGPTKASISLVIPINKCVKTTVTEL